MVACFCPKVVVVVVEEEEVLHVVRLVAVEPSHNIGQMCPLLHVSALARQHFAALIAECSQRGDLK